VSHIMNHIVDTHVAYCKTISELTKVESELREQVEYLCDKIDKLNQLGNELRNCASYIGTVASGEGSVFRRTEEAIQAWDKEAKP